MLDDADGSIQDIANLIIAPPYKVYPHPVSAINVAIWGRLHGVHRTGKKWGSFTYDVLSARAIANKNGRDELIQLERLRRDRLGLPTDDYSIILDICLESGLFKLKDDLSGMEG